MNPTLLKWTFCLMVWSFALFHFTETTVDPDLWGHVIFGQRTIELGGVEKAEPFSWTAQGHAWINHEVLAECALGLSHKLMGGFGIQLLRTLIGLAVLWIAWVMGSKGLEWPWKAVAGIVAMVASVEISFGFAARPQIFTALAIAVQLWALRRIVSGSKMWACFMPVLFLLWINTHGGALAGLVLLCATTGVVCLEFGWSKIRKAEGVALATAMTMCVTVVVSAAALLLNPWGLDLVLWLIESVSWVRPEIQEWNPTPLGWDHAPFFVLLALTIIALACTRLRRAWWEIAIVALLGVMAVRHVRHTPLFAIAALAFVPPHLADTLQRFRSHFDRLAAVLAAPSSRPLGGALFALVGVGSLVSTFTLHRDSVFTMEVPADQYPVSAVRFIQEHEMKGNLFVFFDWGEMCIWELPDCPVSVDGRLDTCYPRSVLTANWNAYNGDPVDTNAMDLGQAEIALIRQDLAGAVSLINQRGWVLVYQDPLAAVMVRDLSTHPGLSGVEIPVIILEEAVTGRYPFPDEMSASVLKGL